MSNVIKKKHPPPISVRFKDEEREQLEKEAGGMTLSAYIRHCSLNGKTVQRKSRNKRPVKDHQMLAQALGGLGASRLSSNMNQLAKAYNCGNLEFDEKVEQELLEACEAIQHMRYLLLRALGLVSEE